MYKLLLFFFFVLTKIMHIVFTEFTINLMIWHILYGERQALTRGTKKNIFAALIKFVFICLFAERKRWPSFPFTQTRALFDPPGRVYCKFAIRIGINGHLLSETSEHLATACRWCHWLDVSVSENYKKMMEHVCGFQ